MFRTNFARSATTYLLVATVALAFVACCTDSLTAWLEAICSSGMMAAAVAADQLLTRRDSNRGGGPVAASTTLYQGTLCFINATGYVVDTTGAGANRFAGLVIKRYDNSAGADGAISCEYWRNGDFLMTGTGFTQASVGLPVFATDNFTVTTTPTDNAVYVGECSGYESSTSIFVTLATSEHRLRVLSESFVFGDFTDGGGTTGHVDFAGTLPAGAIPLGWKAVVATGFTGDTTATMLLGVSGDTDRFSNVATPSVLAAATVGARPNDEALNGIGAAVTPRVTVTGGADFTSIVAGAMTVSIYYLAP